MRQWAQIDTADALELLSPAFKHPIVREFAVATLEAQADADELQSYLLPLVQVGAGAVRTVGGVGVEVGPVACVVREQTPVC